MQNESLAYKASIYVSRDTKWPKYFVDFSCMLNESLAFRSLLFEINDVVRLTFC